jgi:Ca2+-binding EF-hand superfamily protein
MIAELDADGSGSIEFGEFYEMMTHQPNEQESREEIHKIFVMFDVFKTGNHRLTQGISASRS